MLSDKQHIDDFFRGKDDAFMPDEQQLGAHWQQMQSQLADPGPAAVNNNGMSVRRTGKWLGGLITVVIIVILAIQINRSNKRATSNTKQQATVAATTTAPAIKQNAAAVILQTKNDGDETTPAPDVKKITRPDIAMNLIAPPIIKEPAPGEIQNSPEAQSLVQQQEKAPQPDAQALLKSFFDELKSPDQVFTIQTGRDTTLIAKDGTRLVIPTNAFTTKTGPVKGNVRIIIREYIKYEDIIANKLSTTSNGEQLVTGGMLHISAEQDGKEVTIAPKKSIAVSIPTDSYDNNMMLFTGTEQRGTTANASTINWLPKEPIYTWADWPPTNTRTFNLNTVEPVSVNYGKKTTAKFYLSKRITTPKEEIIDQLKLRFGTYYDNIKIKRVRPGRTNQRSPGGEYIVIDSVETEQEQMFAKKVKNLQNKYPDTLQRNAFNNEQQVTQRGEYRFTIDELGWINCDRFKFDVRTRINVNVNLGNAITFDDCFQQLVFVRYRSVMRPQFGYRQTIQYHRIPENEPALLVTVAVKGGKIVSNFMPVVTSNKEIGNLVFEPTTPEQFIQKLRSLTIIQKQ